MSLERELEVERVFVEARKMLRAAMDEVGVNQSRLAEAMGVTKAHVSAVTSGRAGTRRSNPTLRTLAAFFYTLGFRMEISLVPLAGGPKLQRPSTALTRPLMESHLHVIHKFSDPARLAGVEKEELERAHETLHNIGGCYHAHLPEEMRVVDGTA